MSLLSRFWIQDPIFVLRARKKSTIGFQECLRAWVRQWVFHWLGSCLISTCAHRADGPRFTLAGLRRGSPGLVSCSDACIALNVRAGFTGPNLIVLYFCTVSSKNTSWRPANLLTLFQSWQSVVHLKTWGAEPFKLWWQYDSASQKCTEALCIDFLHCDSPEHCAWRVSTSLHKRLLVARPGAARRYFFIFLQWDPAPCAASLFCAGNTLPVNAYFRCGAVRSAHSRQILLTCAQVFPLHCPVHALQWACVTTVRAWRCASSSGNYACIYMSLNIKWHINT